MQASSKNSQHKNNKTKQTPKPTEKKWQKNPGTVTQDSYIFSLNSAQYHHPFLMFWCLSGSSQVAEDFHQEQGSSAVMKSAQLVPMTIIPLRGMREHCQLTNLRIIGSYLYGLYAYLHLSTSKLWEWNSWPPLLGPHQLFCSWVAFSQPAGNNPVWLEWNKSHANVLNYREEQCWGNMVPLRYYFFR